MSSPTTRRPAHNRIRELRRARGWSAQRLSDECERAGRRIPRATLAGLENNPDRECRVSELVILSRALRVPPSEIYPDLGDYGYRAGLAAARDALAHLAGDLS